MCNNAATVIYRGEIELIRGKCEKLFPKKFQLMCTVKSDAISVQVLFNSGFQLFVTCADG